MVIGSWSMGMSNTSATPFKNITYSNNTVTNHGRGLYLFNTDDSTLSGNTITAATNYAMGIFGLPPSANDNVLVSGNHLEGNLRGVWVDAGSSASIKNNNTSIIDGGVGIEVDDASALIENNVLTGHTAAAIRVLNGATVDAGDCTASNFTGLGSSAGNNDISGYGADDLSPWAIENLNASAQPVVLAHNNNFGTTNPELVIFDDSDTAGANSMVQYSTQGGLTITCPPGASLQCNADVPPAATTLAQFLALGGTSSSSSATVTSTTGARVGGSCGGSVTRIYTLTDPCGNEESCSQIFSIDDTIDPIIVSGPADTTVS
jgi:parallel beta-helix repeat protein